MEKALFLADKNSSFKELKLTTSTDANSFDVAFAGIRVTFQLIPGYAEDGAVRGRVVCIRKIRGPCEEGDFLGSFMFQGNGNTDFEVVAGQDPISMEDDVTKIVLRFLDSAIRKPLQY